VPFSAIAGHAPVLRLLRQAVSRDRVPQSLLFAGPEGVGKRAVAVALAQAVNCPDRRDGDACGVCRNCVRIGRGQHSDVILVSRGDEASIKIRTLRERILEQVGFRPFEARRRVYIIDNADDLTPEAQDALLKTLEEPPPSAILILITAYPDTLFPTILSRCRRLRFGLLTEADVARVLEHAGATPQEAHRRAAGSGGSVSRVLAGDAAKYDDDREAALTLLAAAKGGAILQRLKAGAALAAHDSKRRARAALGSRLAIVQSLLRDLALLRAARDASLAHADLEDTLRGLSPAFDLPRVTEAFAAVSRAEHALDRNASPKIVADWLAVTL
jgi:DNA polymerase-3 subunit delta'